jgi:hypothetical protein
LIWATSKGSTQTQRLIIAGVTVADIAEHECTSAPRRELEQLDRNDKNGAESRAVLSGNYRTEPDCLIRSVLFESASVGGRLG